MSHAPAPMRRILFVDDDPAVGQAFRATVRGLGFEAVLASSGAEAIRQARTRFYPIIVTDLRMPGMDGLSLIERLQPLCPVTAFVILTGFPELDLRSDLRSDVAIASVVRKPWEEAELEATLTHAFELHQRRARRIREENEAERGRRLVLLLEDNPADAELAIDELQQEYAPDQIVHLTRLEAAIEWLHGDAVEVVVTDLSLPDARGFDAVTRLHAAAPGTPLVVLSGLPDEDLSLLAIQLGAQDVLMKGALGPEGLLRAVRHARERKRGEQRLLALAQHDPLTGLANRAAFLDRLSVACTRSRRGPEHCAVLFIDLDRFKQVNDTHGHEAGDALLQEAARRIEGTVREYDTVARLGGDELAVLVEDPHGEAFLRELGTRILNALAEPMRLGELELSITGSVGIATFPEAGRLPSDLLRAADAAMYQAKQSGRSRLASFRDMVAASTGPAVNVRLAVRQGDFRLHFQPQVALPGGAVVGVEALLRWCRDGALLAPGHFLAELEETGGIREVGSWVLAQACTQLAAWRRTGAPTLRMALNFSPRQLQDLELLPTLRHILAQQDLPASALDIELPERCLGSLSDQCHRHLDHLRDLGIRLTVDGFGTGHSSPAYLLRHGIRAIKIARPFIAAAPHDPHSARLVHAITGLGRSLDVEVVADGIETEAQQVLAQAAGCTVGQGFLFGTPQAEWSPCA